MKYLALFPFLFVVSELGTASLHSVPGISFVPSSTEMTLNQSRNYLDSSNDAAGQNLRQEPKAAFFRMANSFSDCEYFTQELEQLYTTNNDDIEVVGYILEQLKSLGCLETDPALTIIQARYDELQAAAVQEANRESLSGSEVDKAIKEGNSQEAIRLLEVAIEGETDSLRKGEHFLQIAYIQYEELGHFQEARKNARRAAELVDTFGKPYILLGDIYLKMSRNCGESWQERLVVLAAIEKYEHAKKIDTSLMNEANRRILNLGGSLPLKEDGSHRGVRPGDKVSVGCGIDETITVRFQ